MKRVAILAVAVFAAFAVVGCDEVGLNGATPVLPSGIRGTVVLGPLCAVGSEPGANDPVPSACLTPYAAMLVVMDSENKVVARVSSGGEGTFQVDVPPGDYVVTPATTDSYPIAQPVPVSVSPGQYATVQINYDTGIR